MTSAARMSPRAPRLATSSPIVLLGVRPRVLVGAVGILSAGAILVALLTRRAPPPAPVAPSASPASHPPSPAPGALDLVHVDPSNLYPRAQEQALAWHRDARLVSITAAPVVRDKVILPVPRGIVYLFVTAADRAETRGGA